MKKEIQKEEAKSELAQAAKDAVDLLATQAKEALKTLADAAAEALKNATPMLEKATADHDILIRLETSMISLQEAVKKLTERDELHVTTNDFAAHLLVDADHEKRIRFLERYAWVAIGGLAILQIALGFASFFFKHS